MNLKLNSHPSFLDQDDLSVAGYLTMSDLDIVLDDEAEVKGSNVGYTRMRHGEYTLILGTVDLKPEVKEYLAQWNIDPRAITGAPSWGRSDKGSEVTVHARAEYDLARMRSKEKMEAVMQEAKNRVQAIADGNRATLLQTRASELLDKFNGNLDTLIRRRHEGNLSSVVRAFQGGSLNKWVDSNFRDEALVASEKRALEDIDAAIRELKSRRDVLLGCQSAARNSAFLQGMLRDDWMLKDDDGAEEGRQVCKSMQEVLTDLAKEEKLMPAKRDMFL